MTSMLTLRGPDPLNGQNTQVGYDMRAEYKETYNGKVVESVRLLQVEWPQRFALQKAMMATARAGQTTGEQFEVTPYGINNLRLWANQPPFLNQIFMNRLALNRLPPEPHPDLPYMVAVEAHMIEGVGYPGNLGGLSLNPNAIQFFQNTHNLVDQDGYARVAITYRSLPYVTNTSVDVTGGIANATTNLIGSSELARYVWRQGKPSSQNLPIPGSSFVEWNLNGAGFGAGRGGPGVLIPEPGVKVYPFLRITYHWLMVPGIPPAAYYMMSYLNSTIFDQGTLPNAFPILGRAKIGNVQYLGSEWSDPYFTYHGDQVYDIHHTFIFRQPGFNWRYRPQLGYHVLGLGMSTGPTVINIPGFGLAFNITGGPANLPLVGTPEPLIAGSGLFNYGELSNLFKLGQEVIPVTWDED